MEKQGEINCLLRTLISGLSVSLIERWETNMAQDVYRRICTKSGTKPTLYRKEVSGVLKTYAEGVQNLL